MAVVAIVGLSNVDFDDRTRIENRLALRYLLLS
jgi:hypothetical protein